MKFDFERLNKPENQHVRSLLERTLGQVLIDHLETSEQMVKELAAIHTLKIIESIMNALEDEALDDFQCIDCIVDILGEYGLHTSRHDW